MLLEGVLHERNGGGVSQSPAESYYNRHIPLKIKRLISNEAALEELRDHQSRLFTEAFILVFNDIIHAEVSCMFRKTVIRQIANARL